MIVIFIVFTFILCAYTQPNFRELFTIITNIIRSRVYNTFEYHVFAPMGRFQLELFTLLLLFILDGTTVEKKVNNSN